MAGLQGRVFGGYQLAEQLGSAGIAEVYRARPNKPGGREVVVKVIYPEFARQPGFIPHFREIVQATSKLASHPHILPLLTSGEESGYLYLVTPYVAAGTLKDWIAHGGRMGAGDVGPFFRQLCDALTYAHSLGVVHGDIKPSNVFLFEGRHVLVGDFGLLWDISHLDMEHAGSGMEVVEYLAPEVMRGQVTQQGDVYSIGAVLFAAITGQPPFRGSRPSDVFNAHTRQPVPQLAQALPGLSPVMQTLDAVVQRAMAKLPEQRYPSAAAVGQAIETCLRQAGGVPSSQAALFPVPAGLPQFAQSPGAAQPFMPAPGIPGTPGIPGVPPGFAPLAPGQLGFGAAAAQGALGALSELGGAAGAFGGALGDAISPSIRPLGPQFPPLPASAMVDESMEQGRVTVRGPDQAGVGIAVPEDGGFPQLPTMRMPASFADAGQLVPDAAMPAGDSTGAAAALDPALGGEEPKGRGARGLFSLARKRSGLGKRLGQQSGGPPLGAASGAGEAAFTSQSFPPVQAQAAPPAQGFSVAGGTDPRRAAEGAGWGNDDAGPGSDAESAFPLWSGASGGALDDSFGALPGESAALPAWGASGEFGASSAGGTPREFSATQLGLPRLTSPADSAAPPSWQEIVSGPVPAVRRGGGGGLSGDAEGDDLSLPYATWRSSPDLDHAGRHQESAEWASAASGAMDWSGESAEVHAPRLGTDPWAAVEAPIGPIRMPNEHQRGNRPAPEDDIELDYDEPRRRRRHRGVGFRRRRPWARRVLILLLLLTLLDAAAVVLRPDLCPNATCRTISDRARQALPFFNTPSAQPASNLTVDPASLKLAVATGKTTTAQIKLANTTSAILPWKASAGLPWIALAPSSGSLPAQSGATLIATINAAGVKAGTYATSIAITYGQQTATIPVTIDVAPS